jgi:hypothetical protein
MEAVSESNTSRPEKSCVAAAVSPAASGVHGDPAMPRRSFQANHRAKQAPPSAIAQASIRRKSGDAASSSRTSGGTSVAAVNCPA